MSGTFPFGITPIFAGWTWTADTQTSYYDQHMKKNDVALFCSHRGSLSARVPKKRPRHAASANGIAPKEASSSCRVSTAG